MSQLQKNKNRSFWIEYNNGSYPNLLRKFKGDITKLNAEIKKVVIDYITKNKKTSYVKIRKKIYVNDNDNEEISVFCTKKNITRADLAELIKNDLLSRYI